MLRDDRLDAIDARHDGAVLIGRKLNTEPLDDKDINWLFACVSDIPDLLKYVSKLRDSLAEAEACIVLAQGVLNPESRAWLLLDEYDGTGDSVRLLKNRLDLVDILTPLVLAARGFARNKDDTGALERLAEAALDTPRTAAAALGIVEEDI